MRVRKANGAVHNIGEPTSQKEGGERYGTDGSLVQHWYIDIREAGLDQLDCVDLTQCSYLRASNRPVEACEQRITANVDKPSATRGHRFAVHEPRHLPPAAIKSDQISSRRICFRRCGIRV